MKTIIPKGFNLILPASLQYMVDRSQLVYNFSEIKYLKAQILKKHCQ